MSTLKDWAEIQRLPRAEQLPDRDDRQGVEGLEEQAVVCRRVPGAPRRSRQGALAVSPAQVATSQRSRRRGTGMDIGPLVARGCVRWRWGAVAGRSPRPPES